MAIGIDTPDNQYRDRFAAATPEDQIEMVRGFCVLISRVVQVFILSRPSKTHPSPVYRGIMLHPTSPPVEDVFPEGAVLSSYSVLSTTMDPDVAKLFSQKGPRSVTFRIFTDPDTLGFNFKGYEFPPEDGDPDDEAEIALPPGTKLVVRKRVGGPHENKVVWAQIVENVPLQRYIPRSSGAAQSWVWELEARIDPDFSQL